MIRSITIKARDIFGTAATYYYGKDNLETLFFQSVFGASFSGDGITYIIERDISSITVSSQKLTGIVNVVEEDLSLYLDAANPESYPGTNFDPTDPGSLTTWYCLSEMEHDSILVNGVSHTNDAGGSFFFDGINDFVTTGRPHESESFSIGAWIRTSSPGIKMIFSKETSTGMPWNYRLWLNGGQIVADIATTSQIHSLTSPNTNYNDGNWYNIYFTRGVSSWHLYVNGIQIASKDNDVTGSIIDYENVLIGRSAYLGGSYNYSGDISAVFIYMRQLSAEEIQENFDATKTRFGF